MDALSVTELMKENTRLRAELQDLNMRLSAIKVKYLKMWCDDRVGKGYDWTGVLRFVVPILPQLDEKWFCSELCGAALKYVGILSVEVDVHGLSPQGLYMQLLRLKVKSPLI